MYERILIPTDGSEGTEGAIDRAIELANTFDAALHVIYVVDTEAVSAEVGAMGVLDALEEAGRAAVDEAVERAEAGDVDTIEAVIARGAPARAILDYADGHDIDLIVMGTHGRTGLDRYLLGSVTERVVRRSDAPVLTVSMGPEGD